MATLVIKIGTSSLTRPETGDLNLSAIARLVETAVALRRLGHRVLMVSSGAVGVGCSRLGLTTRPQVLAQKQAVAAVGQGRLMGLYDDFFAEFRQPVAQVLLTRDNLLSRRQYQSVCTTLETLLTMGVIPIANENDTVATEELKFGDNDTLSALVAGAIAADWLFLLTDVDRLYSANPKLDPQARPIAHVTAPELMTLTVDVAGDSRWGTGGMATKLAAARIAVTAGVQVAITKGSEPERLLGLVAGEPHGTVFAPDPQPLNARKRWLAYGAMPVGTLWLDRGAVVAVRDRGRSLLPVGIVAIEGEFEAGDAVRLGDRETGQEVARGLVNYGSPELRQILGHPSTAIATILGVEGEPTAVHRDNLVVLPSIGSDTVDSG
ncbi:MAG TPA: glutamate 5-kinase [Cyanobacteria bacterium UBA8156]|nr:glutamate 5-kinase [Cyanobacteria bacterium UBA8156]